MSTELVFGDRTGRFEKFSEASWRVVAVVTTVLVLIYSISYPISQPKLANLVLGLGTATFYFHYASMRRAESDSRKSKLYAGAAYLAGVVFFASTIYVHLVFERWLSQGVLLIYNTTDILVGAFIVIAAVHVTYQKYGGVLAAVIVAVILYGLVGNYLPGIWQHAGYSPQEFVARQTVAVDGVYSFILEIMATWVAIFLILAGLVEEYGGFDYIVDVGMMVARKSKSGLVQVAILSSMAVGMMTGAAVANVAITGSFTIPLMKEHGIPRSVAGAIESVASTGGQILPPIMGLAAFLMADIIGIPFADVVIAGFLPAVLFYVIVATGVHFRTKKHGWVDDVEEGEGISLKFILRGLEYTIPILVLIYVLLILEYSPLDAGKYTIGSLLLTTGVRYIVFDRTPKKWLIDSYQGLVRAGEMIAPFLGLGAALGIIINIYGSTGLGQKIALNLMLLAGEVVLVAILIVMFVSLLFGMGMPTPAAYVLVATILAPALVQLGFTPLVSHMYVFYFALLSAITPPVAVPVAMATTISGAGFWPTVKESLQFGIWLFLIPFMFLFNPSLIHWAFPVTIIQLILISSGCIALVYCSSGYNGFTDIGPVQRGVAFVIGLVTIFGPTTLIQSSGLVAIVIFTLVSILGVNRDRIPSVN
jgi:TRAP transporter 4TM/12TM fusion protein